MNQHSSQTKVLSRWALVALTFGFGLLSLLQPDYWQALAWLSIGIGRLTLGDETQSWADTPTWRRWLSTAALAGAALALIGLVFSRFLRPAS